MPSSGKQILVRLILNSCGFGNFCLERGMNAGGRENWLGGEKRKGGSPLHGKVGQFKGSDI